MALAGLQHFLPPFFGGVGFFAMVDLTSSQV